MANDFSIQHIIDYLQWSWSVAGARDAGMNKSRHGPCPAGMPPGGSWLNE